MQMLDWAEYTKFFLALLVIVNPLGTLPVFISMTAQADAGEKKHIAFVASISVAVEIFASGLLVLLPGLR